MFVLKNIRRKLNKNFNLGYFMLNKKKKRYRRSIKLRFKYNISKKNRLVVNRTLNNIYAQIISFDGNVIVSSSTLEKNIYINLKSTGNVIAAKEVGRVIAERSIKKGIVNVVFDRSGYKYHGVIKSLAESARDNGLLF